MELTENEGKRLLGRSGVKIPKGRIATDPDMAVTVASDIELPVMLKVQVRTGGRGKAGGIKAASNIMEVRAIATDLMKLEIKGERPESLLIEEKIPFHQEYYLAIAIDRDIGLPVVLFSPAGGMDVEKSQESMARFPIDVEIGIDLVQAELIATKIAGDEKMAAFSDLLQGMWRTFWELDCGLVEINPLFLTAEGELIAGDAKVQLDDDALYRHSDMVNMGGGRGTRFEKECMAAHLTGIELEGMVGVIANGAGLTMAALDEIVDAGLKGACFLDLGGSDDPAVVERAIEIVLDEDLLPDLKSVFICIFGGITRCDIVAEGIVRAYGKVRRSVPMIVRMRGVNEKRGREMLLRAGIQAHLDMGESIQTIKEMIG